MPLDAICLAAVREELSGQITGLKIDKVQQPERDVLILSLRGFQEPKRLLLSAGSGDMRVHLTEHRFENPATPPMFCMLLRKHLTGARIVKVSQPPAERVLEFELEAPDAIGVLSGKRLIIELIGRLSNIILTDSDGIIVDCLRRVGGEISDKRSVLPGLIYRNPPVQEGRLDPMLTTDNVWQESFDAQSEEKTTEKWLNSVFSAMSPLICKELSWRAYGDAHFRFDAIKDGGMALRREFFALMDYVREGRFEPWSVANEDSSPRDFSFTRIMQFETALETRREESFSAMLDSFYTRSAQLGRVRQRSSDMSRTMKNVHSRLVRKLAAQHVELEKTADRDFFRECGDIITANIHIMEKGQSVLTAADFYRDDGAMRDIALDPRKTPQQNAAKYYKSYTKGKNALRFLTEQIRLGESELEYIESVIEEIALAEGEADLSDIRRELEQTGYIKSRKQVKEKAKESAPMRFESSTGVQILAGRNNIQNDKLTLKSASKSDVWLHAQKIHGAHVIISCGGREPDEVTMSEAAVIAAYYSSARSGGKVPIDHTLVKFVKKPAGGRPGMVIYTDQKTRVAIPDEELVMRLRR